MYKRLSGMTGTAKTEEEEFRDIYNMYVVEVPTNKPVIRNDLPDLLFTTVEAKYAYMIEDIKKIHETGQPILIGTVAVETSEIISKLLKKAGIKHEVLNAKNHAREADIIAVAGQQFSVTIATNMAGRGTDIKLGEGVADLGGLAIIGTERHESRRIDNQLRGRSGRQGDPGMSRFYLSADDDLLVRFGGDSFKERIRMLVTLSANNDASQPLESKMFSKVVSNAQKRIEGNNYDSRKNVLKYDEVLRKQREMFYGQRREVIERDDVTDIVNSLVRSCVEVTCDRYITEVGRNQYKIDDEGMVQAFNGQILPENTLDINVMKTLDEKEIVEYVYKTIIDSFSQKEAALPQPEVWKNFEKYVTLRVLTSFWTTHIDTMSALRQSVRLQSYAQQNPLILYQQEGFERFDKMMDGIATDITKFLSRAQIKIQVQQEPKEEKYQTNQADDESLKRRPTVKAANKKVGPNEPCPCGSGKKYKYCCGVRR